MTHDDKPVHPSITPNIIMAAVERRRYTTEDPGFCIGCGLEHGGIEPDARGYACEGCGEPAVYGVEELLLSVDL